MATQKQIDKVQSLAARYDAGQKIRETEWPVWLRGPKPASKWSSAQEDGASVREYLNAMGISDEADADPRAINWDAYRAHERGQHCESCGRCGKVLCDECYGWSRTIERSAYESKLVKRSTIVHHHPVSAAG